MLFNILGSSGFRGFLFPWSPFGLKLVVVVPFSFERTKLLTSRMREPCWRDGPIPLAEVTLMPRCHVMPCTKVSQMFPSLPCFPCPSSFLVSQFLQGRTGWARHAQLAGTWWPRRCTGLRLQRIHSSASCHAHFCPTFLFFISTQSFPQRQALWAPWFFGGSLWPCVAWNGSPCSFLSITTPPPPLSY